MAATQGSLAAAEASADGNLTALDDKIDVEDHIAYLWLKAHQLKGIPGLPTVIGTEILPPDWNARKKLFITLLSAQSFLQTFVKHHSAMLALQAIARSLAPPQLKAPTSEELIATVAASLFSGRAWVIQLPKGGLTSRFYSRAAPAVFAPLNPKYGTRVDFAFIASMEGDQRLRGYLPFKGKTNVVDRNSGMTIASGFDLGQIDLPGLKKMGLPQTTIDKFKNFLAAPSVKGKRPPSIFHGKTKQQAATIVGKLAPVPELNKTEADQVDRAVFDSHLTEAINAWNAVAGPGIPRFAALPVGWQTVWFSRVFQEGRGPSKKALPHAVAFRQAATSGQWQAAIDALGAYTVDKGRITKEIGLLKKELPPPPVAPKR